MNTKVWLRRYLSRHSLGVVAHIRVRGIPQVGLDVGSQSVNHRVEQLLSFMNLRHYLFFWLHS